MPLRYHVWGAMDEAILKPPAESLNSFWIKKSHRDNGTILWDNFPHVRSTKLSRILSIVLKEYVKGDGMHSVHFSLLKNSAVLNS